MRRMSDTPSSSRGRGAWNDYEGGGEAQENINAQEQQGKGMMQSTQEMVAKALGGGSRGIHSFIPFLFFFFPTSMGMLTVSRI